MPYYHATREANLPSIARNGLGGGEFVRNFPDAVPGVYLSTEPILALSFLMEHFFELAHDDSKPNVEVASWRVIVIDDSRVDQSRLLSDPQIPDLVEYLLYKGVIDITGLAILDTDQLGIPAL